MIVLSLKLCISVIWARILQTRIWLNCLVYERQITFGIRVTRNLFCWTWTCFKRISQTKRNRDSGENFSYRWNKKEVLDTFINTIKANSSRYQSKIPKTNCFQQNTGSTWTYKLFWSDKIREYQFIQQFNFQWQYPKGIRMYQFNRALRNHRPKMLNFPGASFDEILHYIDVHLKEKLIDTIIVHVGVNDRLNESSQLKINQLIENIKKITQKCVSFGVKKIYVSGLVFTARVDLY